MGILMKAPCFFEIRVDLFKKNRMKMTILEKLDSRHLEIALMILWKVNRVVVWSIKTLRFLAFSTLTRLSSDLKKIQSHKFKDQN
jgi:hypothetical protein